MTLDWKTIKKKCPKAFEVLVKDHETIEEWGEIDNPTIWGVHIEEPHWVIRHLYDFFDSKDLIVLPENIIIGGEFIWYFSIGTSNNLSFFVDYESKFIGRKETEIAAFTKAFELLEDKLKKSA